MNPKSLLILSICLLTTCSLFMALKKDENCTVKYNGIYAVKLDNEHSAVLRFYADGTVLASTSVNDYMDVFTWFHKDNKDMVLAGKYKIKKCGISFSVTGSTGEQYYNGDISEKNIYFRLTDKESKRGTTRMYTFYAL